MPLFPTRPEISFASLGHDGDSTFGGDLLARIIEARKPHFLLSGSLQKDSFLRGEDARASGAWAEPETWGTWLGDQGGELVLGLAPDPSALFYVFLRLRASGPAGEARVTLRFNGDIAWEGIVGDKPRDIVLQTLKRQVSEKGGWLLRIRVDGTISPEVREKIAAIDSRVPTIGFERIVVVPEHDLKTRVDIISRLLL